MVQQTQLMVSVWKSNVHEQRERERKEKKRRNSLYFSLLPRSLPLSGSVAVLYSRWLRRRRRRWRLIRTMYSNSTTMTIENVPERTRERESKYFRTNKSNCPHSFTYLIWSITISISFWLTDEECDGEWVYISPLLLVFILRRRIGKCAHTHTVFLLVFVAAERTVWKIDKPYVSVCVISRQKRRRKWLLVGTLTSRIERMDTGHDRSFVRCRWHCRLADDR